MKIRRSQLFNSPDEISFHADLMSNMTFLCFIYHLCIFFDLFLCQ
ncbi:hypothetical protein AC73_3640 [Escherichia coli 2-427-07_S4_C1]|nr:hypothetical protein ECRN5871_2451 [Escherichia coli RN587/1]EHU04874.1 hypothetical protein ECDEC1A_3964 [Escherichia coli DEC1A]EHU37785.1 hypothetical protein ECDEC2C_4224 [Escherichia coli DEC2C]KDY41215.1 hypothetical protein AC73_3640 [Escherichia coli 2-427-07_S4_C1]